VALAAGGGYLFGSNIATQFECGVNAANSDEKAMEQKRAEKI